jgi:hypothetical protein
LAGALKRGDFHDGAPTRHVHQHATQLHPRHGGGELEIIATFPEGQVKIENFAN